MKGSGNNFSSPEQDIGTVSERSGSERCEYVQLGEGELKAGTCGSVQHDAQNIYHSNRKDVGSFGRHSLCISIRSLIVLLRPGACTDQGHFWTSFSRLQL